MPNDNALMNQLGLSHLDSDGDEIEWPSALGWKNFKILNVFHQIY
jgi:hypothetical protein